MEGERERLRARIRAQERKRVREGKIRESPSKEGEKLEKTEREREIKRD